MIFIAFLILSQTALAKLACEPPAGKPPSLEKNAIQMAQVSGQLEDSRPYTNHVTCITHLDYVDQMRYKKKEHLGPWEGRERMPGEVSINAHTRFDFGPLSGVATHFILNKDGIRYTTEEHFNNEKATLMMFEGETKGKAKVVPMPFRTGAPGVETIDEDKSVKKFATTVAPLMVDDEKLARGLYRSAIQVGLNTLSIIQDKDRQRVKSALCECIRVNDKDVRKAVRERAKVENISLEECELEAA